MGISEATGKVGSLESEVRDRRGGPCERLIGAGPVPGQREAESLLHLLEACLSREGLEHQRLAPMTVRLLKRHPGLRPLLDAADRSGSPLPDELRKGDGGEALADPILSLALTRMVIPDLQLERLFTSLRTLALEIVLQREAQGPLSPDSLPPPPVPPLAFLVALARQCFLNGYVYPLSDAEPTQVRALAALVAEKAKGGPEGEMDATWIALLACYDPIGRWEHAPAVAAWIQASGHPELRELARQQFLEPREEEGLRKGIRTRGEIRGRVSEQVRAHYEENPYPRWISVDRSEPRAPGAVLAELFPDMDLRNLRRMKDPRILVAGCGTGLRLLQLHHRFRGARIHGVDLSLSSLAFAKRKIQEHGADGITLEQADILSLAGRGERFDIIESVGVLQHLEDPLRGWRILRDLLKPSGLMRIGVYSRLARSPVARARKYLRERGYGSSEEEVRRARIALAERFPDQRESGFLSMRDFFSMQECRDLLFHAHESTFTLPQIAGMLESLELAFLGFELPDPGIRAAFLRAHPEEGAEVDLDAWHDFETRNPTTFVGLYQFWLRAV